MALQRCCVCVGQPPWNLSGEWQLGPNGELVKLRHWRFVGAIWSTLDQPTPGTETFIGKTFSFEGEWFLRATFGTEDFQVGSVQDSNGEAIITWTNGARWVRRRESGLFPRTSSLPITPLRVFKSSACCQSWTTWIIIYPILIYFFPWQCAVVLLVNFVFMLLYPRLYLTSLHTKALGSLILVTTAISIFGSWLATWIPGWPSSRDGYRASGSILIVGVTIVLINWIGMAFKFKLKALFVFRWVLVGRALHVAFLLALVIGLCVLLWPRNVIVPYMCVSVILGICSAVRGAFAAMHENRVAAEDAANWQYVEHVDADTKIRLCERFQADCEEAKDMYPFSLTVEKVYAIQNPALLFGGIATNVRSLYHGTSSSGAKGIASEGFQLPVVPGMFGRGLYFADIPLKSWQYSAKSRSRYIVVCDVALGRPLEQTKSAHSLSMGSLQLRGGFDSVIGVSRREGGELRLPEYVVYRGNQVIPQYLLEISETMSPSLSGSDSNPSAPLLDTSHP